jgi:hypothetical protein
MHGLADLIARETPVRTYVRRTTQLGDLVVAAFDGAARYSTDPYVTSRLATQAVAHMLKRARRVGRVRSAERAVTPS